MFCGKCMLRPILAGRFFLALMLGMLTPWLYYGDELLQDNLACIVFIYSACFSCIITIGIGFWMCTTHFVQKTDWVWKLLSFSEMLWALATFGFLFIPSQLEHPEIIIAISITLLVYDLTLFILVILLERCCDSKNDDEYREI